MNKNLQHKCDNSVYGDNKLMRLVYNHKFDDNRISEPIDDLKLDYKDTLIEIKPEDFSKFKVVNLRQFEEPTPKITDVYAREYTKEDFNWTEEEFKKLLDHYSTHSDEYQD